MEAALKRPSSRRRGLESPRPHELEDIECLLRDRLEAIGPTSRAVLQHILLLPDDDRASRIGDFSDPRTQTSRNS